MKSLLFLKSSGSHVSKAAIVTIAALFPALVWAVCTCGFGDGYTLPGRFANVPSTGNPTRTGTWGSANGTQMEFYVT